MTSTAAKTAIQVRAERLIRNYGTDRDGMKRLLERYASANDEGWTVEECHAIAAILLTHVNRTWPDAA